MGAFEILAACVLLSDGSIEEQLDMLFPIFDLSSSGRLNFDEANILVQSGFQGIAKATSSVPMEHNIAIEACSRMFDLHNLAYDKQISKEQFKRWVRTDVDAIDFINAFQGDVPTVCRKSVVLIM